MTHEFPFSLNGNDTANSNDNVPKKPETGYGKLVETRLHFSWLITHGKKLRNDEYVPKSLVTRIARMEIGL